MRVEAWFKMKPVSTTSYRHPAFAKVGKGNGLLYLEQNQPKAVMRGLDPRIHAVAGVASGRPLRARMAGSSPAMTYLEF
jgi:hypothetical protein